MFTVRKIDDNEYALYVKIDDKLHPILHADARDSGEAHGEFLYKLKGYLSAAHERAEEYRYGV
jgi:hypothetical protein